MKFFKDIASVVLILILFVACQKKVRENIIYLDKFSKIISLKCDTSFTLVNVCNPYFMELQDSVLILGDFESYPHFYLYSVPKFRYLKSFGYHGNGPTEFLYPYLSGNRPLDYKITILDLHSRKVSLVDLRKILSNSYYKMEKTMTLPPELLECYNVIFTNDNNIKALSIGGESEGEFVSYNFKTKKIYWNNYFEDYNKYKDKTSKELFGVSNSGSIKLKPDGEKFVKSFRFKQIIDVYDKNGSIDFSIVKKGFKEPVFDTKKNDFGDSTVFYYYNVFLTDGYIYALFENYSHPQKEPGDVEIHVFSWNGDAVCNYKLNEGIGFKSPFVVDERSKKIYTYNPYIEGSELRVFDISQGHLDK